MTVYMRLLNKINRRTNREAIPQSYQDLASLCCEDLKVLRLEQEIPQRSPYWWVDVIFQHGQIKTGRDCWGDMQLPLRIDYCPATIRVYTHGRTEYENLLTQAHEWGHIQERVRFGGYTSTLSYYEHERYAELYALEKMRQIGYTVQTSDYLDKLEKLPH